MLFQEINSTTARVASDGASMPPTLWAVFHMAILVPLSLSENQCVMIRAQGAHPIPWNHPLANQKTAMKKTEGRNPKKMFTRPERISPVPRNQRGFDLSETFPMMNLLIP